MDPSNPEYRAFSDDLMKKLQSLSNPIQALGSFISRIPPNTLASLFGQVTEALYGATVQKGGRPSTVQIIVHKPPPSGYQPDITFMPTEILLKGGDPVEWRMAGGGTRCEVEFHASPFKSGATVVSSGNQETIRADLPPYSGWKYRLTAVDGTRFEWPGGARCPEIIIQK
jgi:hypothetical protein